MPSTGRPRSWACVTHSLQQGSRKVDTVQTTLIIISRAKPEPQFSAHLVAQDGVDEAKVYRPVGEVEGMQVHCSGLGIGRQHMDEAAHDLQVERLCEVEDCVSV